MKNGQVNDDSENLQAIFDEVRRAEFSAPPFLRTRVLAYVREGRSLQRKLFFWKALSAFAMAALIVVSVVGLRSVNAVPENVVHQVYVIHVDFTHEDQTRIAKAQVFLPEGVEFESKRAEIRGLRQLTLPVKVAAVGRGKLPFVLSSNSAGEKMIKVRLLDHDDRLVREQEMKFRFAQVSEGATL